MKKLIVLAVLALALIATPAMAAKEGPYIGGSLSYSHIAGSDFDYGFDDSTGLELRVGYNFGSIAVEGNILGVNQTGATGYYDADISAVTVDLRLSFSQTHDPSQVYILVGLGSYELETPIQDFEGSGFNLGVGLEHFFNEQVALDLRGVYRFVTYDKLDGYSIPDQNGDMLTLGVGLNLHF